MTCEVCRARDGKMNLKAVNALPQDVSICDECRKAVARREVGIVRREDGSLSITDGRQK